MLERILNTTFSISDINRVLPLIMVMSDMVMSENCDGYGYRKYC